MIGTLRLFAAISSAVFGVHGMAYKTTSTTVRLGDIAYYMHSSPHADLETGVQVLDINATSEPCTLITIGPSFHLESTIKKFSTDDVWTPRFLKYVIIQADNTDQTLSEDDRLSLSALGTESFHVVHGNEAQKRLPEGPYFVDHGRLHGAYRLYPDTAGAFVVATIPAVEGDGFRALDASAYGEQYPATLTVAVPSRLYFNKTEDKPFAGSRVAVKDIIDLKGLKTGGSSRAYTELYPPRETTASAVQRLIDLGFVVVGKTKTTQFADSEWPTADWVDYHGPFNPHGDGYLTPSGSSAGSASAVSTYSWLDFALGTDRSIRSPAAAQAIFGMRPTLGAVGMDGVIPYSSNWDTIGALARTGADIKILAQALYGTQETATKNFKLPTKLIYPTDYWPVADAASQKVFDNFVSQLETLLGVQRVELSLAETWRQTRPDDTSESIAEQFHHVFDWSANRDQWTGLLEPFIKEYTEKTGKPPVLNPQVRFKVSEYTPSITAEQKREGERLLAMYHDWFYEQILAPSKDGYSSSIIILPWTNGEPDYRDKYKTGPQQFTGQGFFFYNVGPYAQCPELIFPEIAVGTTPYVSKFHGMTEELPAAVGIMAAKGSDIMLADLVAKIFQNESSQRLVSADADEHQVPISNEL
ncbi:hypothetical protein PG985_010165 [Apiospora marii]|uniref:Amidase domain-containing protein n=1 Tax=Apiospora marii TaxID=335849 RepID=A0ABR1RN88_9PEZI